MIYPRVSKMDEKWNKKMNKVVGAWMIASVVGVSGAFGATSAGQVISNNVPGFIKTAKRTGATDSTRTIEVLIWLKVRNRAELDKLAGAVYDPDSPSYHKWLRPAEFATDFAPSAQDAAKVASFFSSNGLSVVETGPQNMYVRARGTVAQVNQTFHVQLNDFELDGQSFYGNTSAPVVAGAAGALTQSVYGLDNLRYQHPNASQVITKGAAPTAARAAGLLASSAPIISSACLSGSETVSVESGGNSYPYATLKGNGYSTKAGSLGTCGYTPPEIHTAYGLTKLYEAGLDGKGQTIVIIDWCGSPTIRADANAFSAAYGLPPLTSANFKIINSSSPPTCAAPDPEINIDVEWAHAIAPGANIDLVVPPSSSFLDVDTGEFFAIINGLGSVISGSYGSEEIYDNNAELQTESLINEIAAVQGISANFSSGDGGDYTGDEPQFNPASVSAPADTPYATAVGGISLMLNSKGAINWQSAWGTNVTPIDLGGFIEDPPPEYAFFDGGSGGGPSAVFSKPSFQHALAGKSRLLPDIAWLADPFTGGVIVISEPFQYPAQVYEVYGGTSLACPMFSALWAIANQAAGKSLGQAAQYVYSMPAATILDVKPVTSNANVTATYKESAKVTDVYDAEQLAGPLADQPFVTAIWDYPLNQDTFYVLSFGTDTSLAAKAGWDAATGVGVPNGPEFVKFFKP